MSRRRCGPAVEKALRGSRATLHYALIDHEPTPEAIDSITAAHAELEIDGVIAIGGGSVIDAGKAVSAMLPSGEHIEKFLEGVGNRQPDGSKLPFVAVPTTAGTGSEASANAVITRPGPEGYKRSLRHDNYIPDFALIDAELMTSCPPELTASCSMDAFTQLVEGFLSTRASAFTDGVAWSGLEAVQRSLLRVYQDGEDLQARGDMAYAALCSGIVLANAGLGIIHGLAPALGSMFGIPHGTVCGTLMAAGNELTLKGLHEGIDNQHGSTQALSKYRRLDRLFCPDGAEGGKDGQRFIDRLYQLTEKLQLPKLSAFGAEARQLETIAGMAANKNNPVDLSRADITSLLLKRL
jgi:alcohol dehydrogenase